MSTVLSRRPLLSNFFDDDAFTFPENLLESTRRWFPERAFARELQMPAVNVHEDEKHYTLELAAPGYRKEDLKVNVKDGVLHIASERKEESEEKRKGYTRKEFSYASFQRSFALPKNVDPQSVAAAYRDGLLKVTVQKTKEVASGDGERIVIR